MCFNEQEAIEDHALLRKSLFVLALTILGFLLHSQIHLQPATIAMAGAVLLLLLSRIEPEEILTEIEWPTIFFFIGLFILVGVLEELGIIEMIARQAVAVTGGNLMVAVFVILWLSAIASAFIDNIPFVAAMIPLIRAMGRLGGMDIEPLWWALSLGACFGGNGTLVGASANVVVAGIANKHKTPITFQSYFRFGFPVMLVTVAACAVYMYVRYLAQWSTVNLYLLGIVSICVLVLPCVAVAKMQQTKGGMQIGR